MLAGCTVSSNIPLAIIEKDSLLILRQSALLYRVLLEDSSRLQSFTWMVQVDTRAGDGKSEPSAFLEVFDLIESRLIRHTGCISSRAPLLLFSPPVVSSSYLKTIKARGS